MEPRLRYSLIGLCILAGVYAGVSGGNYIAREIVEKVGDGIVLPVRVAGNVFGEIARDESSLGR